MPYWGANVKNDNYVVQAKIHGEHTFPCPDDLIEFVGNLAKSVNVNEYALAKFYADKIAIAFKGTLYARWVTVDILTTDGKTYGCTAMVEEEANELARVH